MDTLIKVAANATLYQVLFVMGLVFLLASVFTKIKFGDNEAAVGRPGWAIAIGLCLLAASGITYAMQAPHTIASNSAASLTPTAQVQESSLEAPTAQQVAALSTVVQNGGHLYKQPSREPGMALGLIWPGDKVLRLGNDIENENGLWVFVRVVKAAPDRGDGCVPENTEGYARADLISKP